MSGSTNLTAPLLCSRMLRKPRSIASMVSASSSASVLQRSCLPSTTSSPEATNDARSHRDCSSCPYISCSLLSSLKYYVYLPSRSLMSLVAALNFELILNLNKRGLYIVRWILLIKVFLSRV